MTRDEVLAQLADLRDSGESLAGLDEYLTDKDRAALDAAIALLSQPAAPAPDDERVREYERLRDLALARAYNGYDDKENYADLDNFVLPLLQPAAQQDALRTAAANALSAMDYTDTCREESRAAQTPRLVVLHHPAATYWASVILARWGMDREELRAALAATEDK